ncbi:MAG TPA: APC family permease [Acidimicrobiales bacterium]|nr:APC family permease [Acidimicrobiales bacterium]
MAQALEGGGGVVLSEAEGRIPGQKGLKAGALGLISSTVVGVASTAPAYSLAATIGFVVVLIGPRTPIVTILAFVPMLLISFGYNELNKADPDCGTTFTWAARAFGPRTGWMGGWAIVAADVLVMASLAQIAGQYLFLLFNADGIGSNASSGWVLLVGILWIVAMTYICYVGIELSANFQKVLLGVELTMLIVLSVVALVKVGNGTAPPGHLTPSWSWFNPFDVPFKDFVDGLTLMLFIYWGWDTAVSINEETRDPNKIPGQAAVLSTVVLLATYALVVVSVQSFAGLGTKGIGLGNTAHQGDVLSVLGNSVFGSSGFGSFLTHLLLLMVLSSAAASTQTTILPTARTTLSMAVYKAIPTSFGKVHRRHLTPTVSTLAMGGVSIVLYVIMNHISAGTVIADSVSALAVMVAFYYGLTGVACFWYYRRTLTDGTRNLVMRGILPLLGWAIMWSIGGYSLVQDWGTGSSYTSWTVPGVHWHIGGVFLIDIGALLLGVVLMLVYSGLRPPYFRGEVLNEDTPTLVPEDVYATDTGLPDLHRDPRGLPADG